jgi:hypothetical protein
MPWWARVDSAPLQGGMVVGCERPKPYEVFGL